MRINLKTPFAEKDAVKALGARWDAARKIWYITDVPDLIPFMRWIPDLQAATEDASSPAGAAAPAAAKAVARQSSGVITKPTTMVAHCGCNALPWVDCPHTASTAA
ncbi:hypothetical protein DIC66_01265 [Rhodoferax lacus]|uniref:DUF5710 domain-containing protein n=1 Tax=Rhodoferax lacus TaxID=2184758 RepID=A0A3E1RGN6_9BURK|nr:DUF5710 domain-containing protein [Rhodoferax lacus]RFO98547.1 hypothetical protein DIC66_01265 [Rhodoferax lacus]